MRLNIDQLLALHLLKLGLGQQLGVEQRHCGMGHQAVHKAALFGVDAVFPIAGHVQCAQDLVLGDERNAVGGMGLGSRRRHGHAWVEMDVSRVDVGGVVGLPRQRDMAVHAGLIQIEFVVDVRHPAGQFPVPRPGHDQLVSIPVHGDQRHAGRFGELTRRFGNGLPHLADVALGRRLAHAFDGGLLIGPAFEETGVLQGDGRFAGKHLHEPLGRFTKDVDVVLGIDIEQPNQLIVGVHGGKHGRRQLFFGNPLAVTQARPGEFLDDDHGVLFFGQELGQHIARQGIVQPVRVGETVHGRHFHAREEVVPEHQTDGRGREDCGGMLDDERQQYIQVRLIADCGQNFLNAAELAVASFTHARAHGDQLQQRRQRHAIRGQKRDFAALLLVADAHNVDVAHGLDAHQDGGGGMKEFQPGDQAGAVVAQRRNDARLSVPNERPQEL